LQLEKARKLDIDEAVYFEVIRKKTASLIASCCACGAASAGATEEEIERMRLFGEKIGIAFQIKDDLFDFGFDQIGKPLGIDIKEKKMTLPLIYALQQSNRSEKRRIINIIKNKNDEPNQVQMVIDFVRQSGGLAYAETQMKRYQQEAFDLIANLGSDTHRTHLESLVLYTTQRTN
jgi:octaprenyl-diphosphate synthase